MKRWAKIFMGIGIIIVLSLIIYSFINMDFNSKEYKACKIKTGDGIIGTTQQQSTLFHDCMIQTAIENKDISICEGLGDKFECQGRVMKNISFCNKKYSGDTDLDRISRIYCIIGIAGETGDTNYCFLAEELANFCISKTAKENLDYEKCFDINKINTTDDDDKNEDIDFCLEGVYKETKNSDICPRMSNVNKSDDCFDLIAMKTGYYYLCEKISIENKKIGCIDSIAQMNR